MRGGDGKQITIVGRQRQGKTSLMRALCGVDRNLERTLTVPIRQPIMILDQRREFPFGMVSEDLGQWCHARAERLDEGHEPEVYNFRPSTTGEAERWLETVADSMPPGSIFIDEVADWCSSHSIHSALEDLARLGAGYGITLVSAAQRPPMIHSHIWRQSNTLVSFHLREGDRDMGPLAKHADEIAQLDQGQFRVIYDNSPVNWDRLSSNL